MHSLWYCLRKFVLTSQHFIFGDHSVNSHDLSVWSGSVLLGEIGCQSLLGLQGLTTLQVSSVARERWHFATPPLVLLRNHWRNERPDLVSDRSSQNFCAHSLGVIWEEEPVRNQSVADLDLQIRGGVRSSRPWYKGGPVLKKYLSRPSGLN